MKNENKYSEMIDIMSSLHQYVPVVEAPEVNATTADVVKTPESEKVHPLLFAGDELTAARARGCQELRINSDTTTGRLKGLVPVPKTGILL